MQGFAHIAVSSSLPDNVQIPNSQWLKLQSWNAPSATGNVFSATRLQNGNFIAPYSGIYNVFTSITLSTNVFTILSVSINNLIPTPHQGLTSTLRNVQGEQTLSVYGTIRLQAGFTLSVYVYSEVDTVLQKDYVSSFCVDFIGFYGYLPAFSSFLSNPRNLPAGTSKWNQLSGWESSGEEGLVESLTGFSKSVGIYSIIWEGIYQISANVKFTAHKAGRYYVAFTNDGKVSNDDTTGNVLFYDAQTKNEVFTLSLSVTLKLYVGMQIHLLTKGDGDYTIGKESGFFGVFLSPGVNNPGFSSVIQFPITRELNSWVNIEIPILTPASRYPYGQFRGKNGKIVNGRYSHGQRRIYTISALIHVKASTSAGLIFTRQSDGSSLTSVKTGIGTFTKKVADTASYSVCGILELPGDQTLSLYIHLGTREKFQILKGSRISVTTTDQVYQAFHVTLRNPLSINLPSTLQVVSNWNASTGDTFTFTNTFPNPSNSRYLVKKTGIYLVTANVIFKEVTGAISLLISINSNKAKRFSLHSEKGFPSHTKESLSVAGALMIKEGSYVEVYVSCELDSFWSIGEGSTFSAVYIGPAFSTPGVSTVLAQKISVLANGWTQVKPWSEQEADGGPMFSVGDHFDFQQGKFTAPKDGLYLATGSVSLSDASAKDSSFLLNIVIGDKPGDYKNRNGMQDYIENNNPKPVISDYYNMETSGVVSLKRGDVITLWVESKLDANYVINQDSHFSVIMLSEAGGRYASGGQLMLHPAITQRETVMNTFMKVIGWVSNRPQTAPGLFLTGRFQDLDTGAGSITIKEAGIYFVSVHVTITNGNFGFAIGVFTSSSSTSANPAIFKQYGETVRQVYTLKLFGMLYLSTGERITVQIKSHSSSGWENLKSHSALSLARIPPFQVPTTVVAGGDHGNKINASISQNVWTRIPSFSFDGSSQILSGAKISYSAGHFTIDMDGIYLITWAIYFDANFTDGKTRIVKCKIGINGDTSISTQNTGTGTSYVTICHNICIPSESHVMFLKAGSRIALYFQYMQYIPSYNRIIPSLSIQYMHAARPLPTSGFHSSLLKDIKVLNLRDTLIAGWRSETKGDEFYQRTVGDADQYLITDPGVYFVSVRLEVSGLIGILKLILHVRENQIDFITHRSVLHSATADAQSIYVAGVMKLGPASKLTVRVYSDEDEEFTVGMRSTRSLIRIGGKQRTVGVSAKLEDEIQQSLDFSWKAISGWTAQVVGKDWYFKNGDGRFDGKSYVIPETGFYLVTLNVVCRNPEQNPVTVDVVIKYRNVINVTGTLSDRKVLIGGAKGMTTLQINSGLYLSQWDYLQPFIRVQSTSFIVVLDKMSTFSIVKIGENVSSIPHGRYDNGPRLTSDDLPSKIRVQRTKNIDWFCDAVGREPIQYQWLKDMKAIPGATSTRLTKSNLDGEDSGNYTCKATSKGIDVYSNVARLTVFEPGPRFMNPDADYFLTVEEGGEEMKDLLFIKVQAGSLGTSNAMMTFKIASGNQDGIFSLHPVNSTRGTTLSRIKRIDRENMTSTIIAVQATNQLYPAMSRYQQISINVTDINDNPPVYPQTPVDVTIPENTTVGTTVLVMNASDADIGHNAAVHYSIVPGSAKLFFRIDPRSGAISVTSALDREKIDKHILFVEANDGVFSSYAEVFISIADVNEHRPYFVTEDYNVTIPETHQPGEVVVKILASDKDTGKNAELVYNISSGNPHQIFTINDRGEIFNMKRLDYESDKTYELAITIRDSGAPPLYAMKTAYVMIEITDSNDHSPRFEKAEFVGYIRENRRQFVVVPFKVTAVDRDAGVNGKVTYDIPFTANISSLFTINSQTGEIHVIRPLDYEKNVTYRFKVTASDSGSPKLISSSYVTVYVVDENDNAPQFENESAMVEIVESASPSRKIYSVVAMDADANRNKELTYDIVSGNEKGIFHIDPSTGMVYTKIPLDREHGHSYTLNISAVDNGNPKLRSTDIFTLHVRIIDTNDNAPVFNGSNLLDQYFFSVREDVKIGHVVAPLTISDADEGINKELNVTVQMSDFFCIRHVKNDVYHLVLCRVLDYEVKKVHKFYIVAMDQGVPSFESKVTVTITVLNVNDNPPQFQQGASRINLNIDNVYTNMTVHKFYAFDRDNEEGDGNLYFDIPRGNQLFAFKIDRDKGILHISNVEALKSKQIHNLVIGVQDSYPLPPLYNTTEFQVRLIVKPNIKLRNVLVSSYDFEAVVELIGFTNMVALERVQVVVQQYHPDNPRFNLISKGEPVTWYDIYAPIEKTKDDVMRRYIIREDDVTFKTSGAVYMRNVSVGTDHACQYEDRINAGGKKICNGPLRNGESYRLQLRLFERDGVVPVDSHFSIPIYVPEVNFVKATLIEVSNHGIMILSACFCAVYLIVVISILIYVGWKKKHEILYIDHLRERSMIPLDEKQNIAMPLNQSTTYFSPGMQKIQRYETSGKNFGLPGPYTENPYASYEPDYYNQAYENEEEGPAKWISDLNDELSLYSSEDIFGASNSGDLKKRSTVMDYFQEKEHYALNESPANDEQLTPKEVPTAMNKQTEMMELETEIVAV